MLQKLWSGNRNNFRGGGGEGASAPLNNFLFTAKIIQFNSVVNLPIYYTTLGLSQKAEKLYMLHNYKISVNGVIFSKLVWT